MHTEAFEWIRARGSEASIDVIEIGSRDVNGSVRPHFPNARWFGIDVEDGAGVDLVIDAAEFEPDHPADLVVSTEVFEHAERWREIIQKAVRWLRPGGRMLLTIASLQRPPHSAFDGCDLRAGEYYANVCPIELFDVMTAAGLKTEVTYNGRDVYAEGVLL